MAAVPIPSLSPSEQIWQQLTEHINSYFYNADISALEIALSACVSHYHKNADPSWLFIIGPSSGDKTSVLINSCLGLEQTHLMGDLTPRTFLSGYSSNGSNSLLHQIGSGILIFKDFTTFLSKRREDQAEIGSQLREIYDGYFKRDTGKGDSIKWFGKITVIAACTPALERHWGSLSDLGERFLQVRLARKDGIKQAEAAQQQSGREEFIQQTMRGLAKQLLHLSPPITYPPPMPDASQRLVISSLAEIIAHSRGKVPRNNKDEIIGTSEIENSSRASKELAALVSGHAALFRRQQVDSSLDLWIARRVALNSIPINRYIVLDTLASRGGEASNSQIATITKLPPSTIKRITSDLVATDLVESSEDNGQLNHRFTSSLRELWQNGIGPLPDRTIAPVPILVPRLVTLPQPRQVAVPQQQHVDPDPVQPDPIQLPFLPGHFAH